MLQFHLQHGLQHEAPEPLQLLLLFHRDMGSNPMSSAPKKPGKIKRDCLFSGFFGAQNRAKAETTVPNPQHACNTPKIKGFGFITED